MHDPTLSIDTLVQLPRKRYMVRVPNDAFYTKDEIEAYGFALDNIDGKDLKKSFKELSDRQITITKMVEIFDMGYLVKIINKEDVVEVYKTLQVALELSTTSGLSPNIKYKIDNFFKAADKFNDYLLRNHRRLLAMRLANKSAFDLGEQRLSIGSNVTDYRQNSNVIKVTHEEMQRYSNESYDNRYIETLRRNNIDPNSVTRDSVYDDIVNKMNF